MCAVTEMSASAGVKLAYSELRRLAQAYLRGQNGAQTLDPAALVHEAYLRLAHWEGAHWKSRSHFVGVAAMVMRQVLCSQTRRRGAAKRGGDPQRISLHSEIAAANSGVVDCAPP